MNRLQDRVALVTGAASGIGRAIARRFAAEGAAVAIADVTTAVKEGGEPTHLLLEQAGHPTLFIQADVSVEAEVENAVAQTVARFGRLDILVNNAVLVVGKPLLETSYEQWNRALAVGIGGVFLMCRAAVRQMVGQPERDGVRGRIINIASQFGFVAAPEDISYGVAKSSCAYITRQIAVDYAKQGIVCNSVSPGKIITGKPGRSMEPRWIEFSYARTPMPRLGRPDDVANAVLFLASDEASFMTGANLAVDGGWLAG